MNRYIIDYLSFFMLNSESIKKQVGLRNPQQVDQLKNDMMSDNFKFTAPEGRIAGYVSGGGAGNLPRRPSAACLPALLLAQMVKQNSGKIIFLEKGNSKSGLQHIVEEHGNQFIIK